MSLANVPTGDTRWVAFKSANFRLYWIAQLLSGLAVQIQTVAVGWQVYDMTRDPFDLGLVGLSQILPALLLVLVTGSVADRISRRTIMAVCLVGEAGCAMALLFLTLGGAGDVRLIFLVLVALGTARAFYNPARQAIVPNLVPTAHLANAITINATTMQIAVIAGPMAGGLLYGLSPALAFATALAFLMAAAIAAAHIGTPAQKRAANQATWEALSAGFRYIWREKIILGAISLDLFAVLLGGAVALLPVYARDILEIGPFGLGLLRAAPALGAIVVGFLLITRPIKDHVGYIMFTAVFVFGAATCVFAVSEVIWVSVVALVLMGGADMVSVFVRNTLVQLWTPDPLRGRVNAVNQVFIGASNELGAFRAGVTAALIGAVPAVLLGGIGTVAVCAVWARWFPALRQARHLDGRS